MLSYDTIPLRLVYPDSEVHTCSSDVSHYVGYQNQYGGDTMRFGKLDRYGPWVGHLRLYENAATFTLRDSAPVHFASVDTVPDTVRQNGILELDVTVDLNGLLVWSPHYSRYNMQPDRIHYTQR